jgi:hypothetical protein
MLNAHGWKRAAAVMTETVVAFALTGTFSIDRIGDFSRIDARKVRWRASPGETTDFAFRAGNALLHYMADPSRLMALVASEISDEVYTLDPISSPRIRIATKLKRFEGDAGMRHLELIGLVGGDALIYYEQGLERIGLNGEVRWIADPFPLSSSIDSIEADVVRLTRPGDGQLAIGLSSGRRIRY